MKPPVSKAKAARPVEQTFEETRYLKHLIERKIPIRVRMADNDEVTGTVEYYDQRFIRITRKNGPNLFIFKHDIKYFYEVA
jgi:myo-inositol-1(or 4)-monophosphatase